MSRGKEAEIFGSTVRRLRSNRGWTQERLAEAAGLTTTYVGQVERGRKSSEPDSHIETRPRPRSFAERVVRWVLAQPTAYSEVVSGRRRSDHARVVRGCSEGRERRPCRPCSRVYRWCLSDLLEKSFGETNRAAALMILQIIRVPERCEYGGRNESRFIFERRPSIFPACRRAGVGPRLVCYSDQ